MSKEQTDFETWNLLIFILSMMVYTVSGASLEHFQIKFIHESGLSIMMGCVVAIINHYVTNDQDLHFNSQIFFNYVLPPIIFSAGYHMKKRQFFSRIKFIVLFGILGTVINYMLIIGLNILINDMGWITMTIDRQDSSKEGQVVHLSLQEILLMAATLCASDSVAALTMIDKDRYQKVYSILFGEGLVNDAVSIILFKSVTVVAPTADKLDFKAETFFLLVGNFLYISLCSFFIGVFIGMMHALTLKKLRHISHKAMYEICITIFFGLISYLTGELLELSGIISILTTSILMNHYSIYNMSKISQKSAGFTFESISHIAEGFLFFYLGMSIFESDAQISVSFIFLEMAIIVISRLVTILGTMIITNLKRRLFRQKKYKLNIYEQLVIILGGSIRGAIAYSLILSLHHDQSQNVRLLKNTVLASVLITTVILGGPSGKIIQLLLNRSEKLKDSSIASSQLIQGKRMKQFHSKFKHLDMKYFKPLLIFGYRADEETLKRVQSRQPIEEKDNRERMGSINGDSQDTFMLEKKASSLQGDINI